MNFLKILLVIILISFWQCRPGESDQGQFEGDVGMEMDNSASDDKNATLHEAGDTLRLEEPMDDLSENPNVIQMDMDVMRGEQSEFIQIQKPDEKLVPEEKPGSE